MPSNAARCATGLKSITSCGFVSASIAKPVWRHAYTSLWSPKIFNECVDTVRADTWKTLGNCSPAILYILGIIRRRPCDAVKVVVSAPAASEPCTVPAAPASDSISTTLTVFPKMFFCPAADHISTESAIGLEGVIG